VLALKRGQNVPPDVADYLQARLFWRELGLRMSDLDAWPEVKVERWTHIIEAVAAYEAAETKLAQQRAQREAERQSRKR
jgi:hypothetical protein